MAEVVVVTGASSGIGRATALCYARDGAKIGLVARSEESLAAAKEEVERAGGVGLVLPVDVSDPGQVELAAERVERELGPIDVWVNAAVVAMYAPVMEMLPEEFRRITEVGYLGQVYGAQSALRRMLPRDRGRVVLVGSGLAYRGVPLQSAYCGAKFALRGFADSLRAELRHIRSRVEISLIEPSSVNTPFYSWAKTTLPNRPNAAGPVYQPEVVAEAIRLAEQGRRREVFVGWPAVLARLGGRFAPGLTDRVFGRIGYRIQQREAPEPPGHPSNMWSPQPSLASTHGAFDSRARSFSPQLWASAHRGWIRAAAVGALGAAIFAARRRR